MLTGRNGQVGWESERKLPMRINGFARGVLAEETKRLGALLVHYSTDYMFDGEKATPYVEDDPPNPINVYGKTKLGGERAIQAVGCRHLILRPSWVYGARRLYRLCASGAVSWCAFARAIMAHALVDAPVTAIRTEDYPTPARRPRNPRLDCARLLKDHGVALAPWEEALAEVTFAPR